jgi:hypothetical protein
MTYTITCPKRMLDEKIEIKKNVRGHLKEQLDFSWELKRTLYSAVKEKECCTNDIFKGKYYMIPFLKWLY